jgi:glutathione S-transferase
MAEFVLYDAANSPCGRRVRMTLIEKGVPFEIRWLNLGLMDQKQPWYLKLNPNGLVPTLVHGEKVVYESNVINEYLERVWPQPSLVPSDAYEQAQMRMWMAFELEWAKPFRDAIYETFGKKRLKDAGVTEAQLTTEIGKRTSNPFYLKFAKKVLTEPKDEELVADRLAVLFEKMDLMEERLSDGRDWLVGGKFSLADIALAPRLDMFTMIGVEDLYQRYRRIGAHIARVKARPSWAASALIPKPGEATTQVAAAA